MTDREKLLKLLDAYEMRSIKAILNCYLDTYLEDISATQIHDLIKDLNMYLGYKIEEINK